MRLPDLPGDVSSSVIAGSLAVVVAATLGIAWAQDRPEARSPGFDSPPSPYEACMLAANDPGPSGFAGEVCAPLSPFHETPVAEVHRADFIARADRCLVFRHRQVHGSGSGPDVLYCPERGQG